MGFAVITGASTGIGREFARICARDGYDVVLVARSEPQLESLAGELRTTFKRNVLVIAKDLSLTAAPGELFEEISRLTAPVEVLINNAAFGLLGRFWELSEAQQVAMLQLNVVALTELCRLFLPAFIECRRGFVVNVASTGAFQPGPLMSVYCASKAYVVAFSEALHNEARSFGVAVTCVCPGPTVTEFGRRAGISNMRGANRGAMTAAAVAEIGWKAMNRRKSLVVTGRLNALMAFLTRFAPRQLTASLARRIMESL